jgi:hypothetical protein
MTTNVSYGMIVSVPARQTDDFFETDFDASTLMVDRVCRACDFTKRTQFRFLGVMRFMISTKDGEKSRRRKF